MATSFRLTIQRGPNVGKSYDLVKDVVTMGRDMSNDIVINDAESSRHHARFTKQGVTYVVEDLGSTNGTFVNSARLSTPRPLNPGDMVGVGETVAMSYEVVASVPTGATMVGNIDATVVASDLPSAAEMQQMAAASNPPPAPAPSSEPAYEPPTAPMPSPSFDMPSSSSSGPASGSYSSSSSPASSGSDSFAAPAKPAGSNNRNIIIAVVVVVLLCCCCSVISGLGYYAYSAGMFK
jgi:pSer/pThr/pTyr-binding forkhead associated (FHA) protein